MKTRFTSNICFCLLLYALSCESLVNACGRGGRRGPPPDTTKPTIKCPGDIPVTADDKRTYSTHVHWTVPDGSDDRGGGVR